MLRTCPYDNSARCNKPLDECDRCELKIKFDLQNQIIKAFIELLDGIDALDIDYQTGIGKTRSVEIKNIWNKAIKIYGKQN